MSETLLMVQVHPCSRREAVRFVGGMLHLWVMAPPVEGAANMAVVDLLAQRLGIARRQVSLARGAAARHKQIRIAGLTPQEVQAKLAADM